MYDDDDVNDDDDIDDMKWWNNACMHEEIEKYMCLEKLRFFFSNYCAIMVYELESLYPCVKNAKIDLIGLIILFDAWWEWLEC